MMLLGELEALTDHPLRCPCCSEWVSAINLTLLGAFCRDCLAWQRYFGPEVSSCRSR
jgi:hypothetical protein